MVLKQLHETEEKINIIKLSKSEVMRLKDESKSLDEITDYFKDRWNGKLQLLRAKIILYMSDQKAGGHKAKSDTTSPIVESVQETFTNEEQKTAKAPAEENIEQSIEDFAPAIAGIKIIDYLQDKLSPEQFEGFCIGNAINCLSEYRFMGGLSVLKKAASYVNRIIVKKEQHNVEY